MGSQRVRNDARDLRARRRLIEVARRDALHWQRELQQAETMPEGSARQRRIDSACVGLSIAATRLQTLEAL